MKIRILCVEIAQIESEKQPNLWWLIFSRFVLFHLQRDHWIFGIISCFQIRIVANIISQFNCDSW